MREKFLIKVRTPDRAEHVRGVIQQIYRNDTTLDFFVQRQEGYYYVMCQIVDPRGCGLCGPNRDTFYSCLKMQAKTALTSYTHLMRERFGSESFDDDFEDVG